MPQTGETEGRISKKRKLTAKELRGLIAFFVVLLVGSFAAYGFYRLLQIRPVWITLGAIYGFTFIGWLLLFVWESFSQGNPERKRYEQEWKQRVDALKTIDAELVNQV